MSMVTMAERSFDTGVIRLNYVADGPEFARPLVLVHGDAARWQDFADLIPAFAATRRVYALDLRGHGGSGRVPGGYRLRDHAADLAAFLRGCVGRPAAVFGHALGGQVALLTAAHHADLVRAVISGDAPLERRAPRDVPTPPPGGGEAGRAAARPGEAPPRCDAMAEHLQRPDAETLAAADRFDARRAGEDWETLLPRLTCPLLLLQADPDAGGRLTDAAVARARASLPATAHVRFTGIGHGLHLDHPAPILRAVLDFLAARGV